MGDFKSFLHVWCQKRSLPPPEVVFKSTGKGHALRFVCEVRIHGENYTGVGNSSSKKEAQLNACKDFLQHLIRNNVISADKLPFQISGVSWSPDSETVSSEKTPNDAHGSLSRSSPTSGIEHQAVGHAYQPLKNNDDQEFSVGMDITSLQKKIQEAEDVDVSSVIHGNWTLENARSKLNNYTQRNKITVDFKYTSTGPNTFPKTFFAELSFFVPQLKRVISAKESGSSKQSASKSCALSIVRQLYHLKVIDAYSGSIKELVRQIPAYEVSINPYIARNIYEAVDRLGLYIPSVDLVEGEPLLLSSEKRNGDTKKISGTSCALRWSPPIPNWNAWLGINIDQGPFSNMSLDEVSSCLLTESQDKQSSAFQEAILSKKKQLPITDSRALIIAAVENNPVIIIRGDTGCGKTTQVCQYILDSFVYSGRGAECNIIVTQPRRICALSVSERVATERYESLGESAGYCVRFESHFPRPYGAILFCTVGVLLRRLENGLRGVSHIIVDEIHERDVNNDFLLVMLKDMIRDNPSLRVVLMSATIDTSVFSEYFNDCPVIDIPGTTFPVTTYYLEDCVEMVNFTPANLRTGKSLEKDDNESYAGVEEDSNMNACIASSYSNSTREVMKAMRERELNYDLIKSLLLFSRKYSPKGAVLVFLPGWSTIFSLMKYLLAHKEFQCSDMVILPLHSRLPPEDQRKVFEPVPDNVMKIILSTNIAESSITIDNIAVVIDGCQAKMKLFTSHNNMTNYVTLWVSKSNLEQRKGRAGRVCPGVCFRLCSKTRFESLDEHMTPEMLRSPLHELALMIKYLKLGSVSHFLSKALQPPPIDSVIEAEVLLRDLKCLDSNDELTPLGKILAKLPIDPRLGKMMVLACIMQVGDASTTIGASYSTSPDVFVHDYWKSLSGVQRAFAGSRQSDHLTMLNAFQTWLGIYLRSPEESLRFCERKQLSFPMLLMTLEAKKQIKDILTHACGFPEECFMPEKFNLSIENGRLDVITALMVVGFYPNVCFHKDKRKVLTTESKPALIHKYSVLNDPTSNDDVPSPFFIYGEKMRTKVVSCNYLTMITPIHLLLFGARKVELINNIIRLDNWINLIMEPKLAATIVSLRPALDALIMKVSSNPLSVLSICENNYELMATIKLLCSFNIGRYNLKPINMDGRSLAYNRIPVHQMVMQSRHADPEPPKENIHTTAKQFHLSSEHAVIGDTSSGQFSRGTSSVNCVDTGHDFQSVPYCEGGFIASGPGPQFYGGSRSFGDGLTYTSEYVHYPSSMGRGMRGRNRGRGRTNTPFSKYQHFQ